MATTADRTVAVELLAKVSGYTQGMAQAAAATERTAAAMAAAAKAQTQLEVGQKRVTASTVSATRAAQAAAAANRKHAESLGTLGKGFLVVGAVAGAGLGAAVKASIDFGREMANVRALARTSQRDFRALSDAALSVGTQFGFTATQVASGEAELVKAGISVRDILGGGLTGVLTLAAAGQTDLATASTIAASAMTQFGKVGKDIPHIADLLSAGADKALGSVTDLGFALQQVGTPAAQAGISIENTVGALAALAQNAQIGERGGTTLKQVLLQLQAPSKQAAATMERYGISLYDANGNAKDFTALAGNLHDSLTGLSSAQRDNALATIFGSHAIQGARVLYQQGAAGIAQWTAAVNDSGFAAQQATDKLDSLGGDLTKLKAAFQTGLIEAGDQAGGTLRGLVQGLTGVVNAFNALGPGAKTFLVDMTAATAVVGLAGGAALIAVPKYVQFRNALVELGLAASRTTVQLETEAAAAVASGTANAAAAGGTSGTLGKAGRASSFLAAAGPVGIGAAVLISGVQADIAHAKSEDQKLLDKLVGSPKDFADYKARYVKLFNDIKTQEAAFKRNPQPFQGTAIGLAKRNAEIMKGVIDKVTAANKDAGKTADGTATKQQMLERATAQASLAMVDGGQNADAMASALLILGRNADASTPAVKNLAAAIQKDMVDAAKGFESGTDVLGGFSGGNLGKTFKQTVIQAKQFTKDIATATRRGLDPQLITQLLQEGPEKAAPALRKLVSDHSGKLIQLANSSTAALGRIERRAVEQARLTSIAINSSSDQAANDLGAAMRISQAKATLGAKATVQSIAEALHIGAGRARRIAREFGIGLDEGVESGTKPAKRKIDNLSDSLKNIPKHTTANVDVTVTGEAALTRANALIQAAQYASGNAYRGASPSSPKRTPKRPARGGYMRGPGTGTSDSIDAKVSNGEFVVNARATAANLGELYRMNSQTPAFASGGLVGQPNLSDIFSLIQTSRTGTTALTPFATQFATATKTTTRTDAQFIANLNQLAARGFGFLAMQLLEQGDHTAKVVAAQAVKWGRTKLSATQAGLQKSAAQQKALGLLPAELAISSALRSGKNPTLGSIAQATGLDIEDLQAGLQAMQKGLRGNRNAAQLLRGLNTVGSYQQSTWGSTSAMGGSTVIQVTDKSGDPIRAGEKAAMGYQRHAAVSAGRW